MDCLRIREHDELTTMLHGFSNSNRSANRMINLIQTINLNDHAVYFVVDDSVPQLFFSLKYGQLYERYDLDRAQAFIEENREQYDQYEREGYLSRHGTEEFRFMDKYCKKKKEVDRILRGQAANSNLNYVRNTYPALEVVHLCKNDVCANAIELFSNYAFTIVNNEFPIRYLYLYAADDGSGKLIQLYRDRLQFEERTDLSANIPKYDWDSKFMVREL